MEGALRRTPQSDVWLFADGDLGPTGVALASVLAEVLDGRADLAIAAPPRQPGGGLGLVKTAAAYAIRASCGFEAAAPLSGQRAITAGALTRCRPLAGGFGVEVAMTIDAVRAGCRVIEIPADVMHRPTGRTLRGFAHRGRQGMDIGAAVAARLAAPR